VTRLLRQQKGDEVVLRKLLQGGYGPPTPWNRSAEVMPSILLLPNAPASPKAPQHRPPARQSGLTVTWAVTITVSRGTCWAPKLVEPAHPFPPRVPERRSHLR
jgi:hypothetical protein